MADTATLNVTLNQVQAIKAVKELQAQLKQAQKEIENLEKESRKAESGVSSSFGNMKKAVAGLAAALGAGAAGSFLFNTIKEFETLKTTLTTTAGGVEQGAAAFALLQDLAKETPNSLQQVVEAFNILAARGIKPSREELISFANTASATGRNIVDFAEAVADAQTGQFERLKAFGILVRKEGNELVVQTGEGTQRIKNISQEFVAELNRIGQVNFGGAAANQMATLGGQISNLGDQFSQLAFNIGEGGLRQAISEVFSGFAEGTEVSETTARAIGEILGNAVRSATSLVRNFTRVLGELGPVLAGIAAGATVIGIADIARAIGTATTATRAWTAALLSNPVGIIAAAVAGLVTILGLFVQSALKSEGVSASWFDILRAGANIISRTLAPAIQGLGNFIAGLGGVINSVGGFFRGLVNIAVGTVKSIVDLFVGMARAVFDAFKASAQNIGDIFKAITLGASGDFSAAGSLLLGAFNRGFNVKNSIARTVSDIKGNFTTDWVGLGITWAQGAVSGFTDEVKKVAAASAASAAEAEKAALAQANAYQASNNASEEASEASNKHSKSKSKEIDAVKKFIEKLRDQKADLQLQVDTYGQTESQILATRLAREAETLGIAANSKAIQDNVALQQELQELRLREFLSSTIDDIKFETEALSMNTKERAIAIRLREAERRAKIAGRPLTREEIDDIRRTTAAYEDQNAAIEAGKRAMEEAKRRAEEMERKRQEMARETNRIYLDGFRAFGEGISEMILQSRVNLQQLLLLAIRTAAQIAAATYALRLNNGGSPNIFGGFITGLAGTFGGFSPFGRFGGFRERGGPVSAGRPYVVGEKRPELFVPRTDGYILPSVPTMRQGSGGVTIEANFYGNITASNLDEVRQQITRSLRDSISNSRLAMVDELRPGGLFYGRS